MSKNNTLNDNQDQSCTLWKDLCDDSILQLLDEPFELNESSLRTDEKYLGFDNNAGDSWIYPTNYPIRTYQLNITQSALFRNTLVVLPTGLGKTFIAAVVMYNIYRWYPTGKIIFLAPTKPLVTQQIEACYNIMGIAKEDTAEITGVLSKKIRVTLWQTKRVFFATPQAVRADIVDPNQNFPFSQIKLIVFDEAHKAKGRYAYTEVAQSVWNRNKYFRVLALTATPGRRLEDVAEVCRNLFISHLEVRCENSIDVAPFLHKRKMKTVVVPMGEEINSIRTELIEIVDPYIRSLIDHGVLSSNQTNFSRNWLFCEQKKFRETCLVQRHPEQSTVNTNFSMAISLYYALELLERHGKRVFLNNFEENDEKIKFTVAKNWKLRILLEKLRKEAGPNPFNTSDQTMTNGEITEIPKNLDFGHPKFEKAREFLLEHFENNVDSRAIVFCEYRESVMLMHRLLLQHRPLLNPKCFVGQGGSTGFLRAITQKQQVQIMTDFRNGACNILIATSIGEEGIDVGEVDLIICFDINTTNPTRFIQRIGRTGRKKDGKVIMLVTEGKEAASLKEVLACKDKLNNKLSGSSIISSVLYKQCPRLVPTEFNPTILKTSIQVEEPSCPEPKVKLKKSKSKTIPVKGSQDVRKYFKKAELDPEDREIFAETVSEKSIQAHKADHLTKIQENFREIDFSIGNSAECSQQIVCVPKIDIKRIRKVNKFLRSSTPTDNGPTDIFQILKSKELAPEILRLYLENNANFVREIHKKMEVIRALEEDNLDVSNITKEEQDIREVYEIIEHSFGSKIEILEFLEKNPEENEVDEHIFSQLKQKYDDLFSGLKDEGFCCDNFEYIEEQMQEIEKENEKLLPPDETSKCSTAESMVYETMPEDCFDSVDNYEIIDSKYCSQWNEMCKKDTLNHQSTPIRGYENRIVVKQRQEITESPIVKAFAKQEAKITESPIVKAFAKQEAKISYFNLSTSKQKEVKNNDVVLTKIEETNNIQLSQSRDNSYTKDITEKTNVDSFPCLSLNKETDSIPLDFFDDDFEDIITKSEIVDNLIYEKTSSMDMVEAVKIFSSNETNSDKNCGEVLNQPDSSFEVIATQTSNVALDIISAKETDVTLNKTNITNPELEDFDLNDFLEPFPDDFYEENSHSQLSTKEICITNCVKSSFRSPNIFDKKDQHVLNEPKLTLASKLAQIARTSCSKTPNVVTYLSSPGKSENAIQKESEISPSIFNRNNNIAREMCKKPHQDLQLTRNAGENNSFEERSPIVRSRQKLPTKRKIISSDSENEKKAFDNNTSSEEIFPNSPEKTGCRSLKEIFKQRMKRRRRCAFIIQEAEVENDSVVISDDESEPDSIVVADEDVEDEEDASSVNMHAKYLQSIRSPVRGRGFFKIPTRNASYDPKIFSQAQIPQFSQYELDSFVVNEKSALELESREDKSICPLERAEQILKNRKRAKRKAKHINDYSGSSDNCSEQKRRKRLKICDSSDDEGDFE